jgi:hypothetical protein
MSVTVRWDDPDQMVLHMDVNGKWAWADFRAGLDRAEALQKSAGSETPALIIDFTRSRGLPTDTPPLDAVRSRKGTPIVVFVKGGRSLTAADQFVRKAYPLSTTRPHRVKQLDEAYTLLADIQPEMLLF